MKITKFRDIPQFVRHGSYEVDVSPESLISTINDFVEQGLDLDPDFQRGHVWSDKQRVAFVEFFLRGGKTGRVIYLNNPNWHFNNEKGYNDFVIVDGKQRVEAFRKFINNEIKAFGSYYREYTDSIRLVNTMKINVNDLRTRADVLQWYIDFNAGGVVHSDKEISRVRRLLKKETSK
jgi:hypothetical protein